MLLRILLISAMLLIVAYSAALAQESYGYYPPEGGHCTYWPDLGGTICGNEPVTQYDVTGWSWGCGAPEGEPELTHCEWTPTNNFPGRAQ